MNSINKPLKLFVMMAVFLPAMSSCNKSTYKDYSFKYWNANCMALNSLKTYVQEATDSSNKNFIPKVDRIATFDMDGTLFGERAPIYIEWLMFDDYLTKIKENKPGFGGTQVDVKEDTPMTLDAIDDEVKQFMEGQEPENLEMHEAYGGAKLFSYALDGTSQLTITDYIKYVDSYLKKEANKYFTNLKFEDMFYKPMVEVVEYLQQNDFDVYIVSGTDRFMVREIVNIQNHKYFNIPTNKVIGMDVNLEYKNGKVYRGDKLMYKNVKNVKVELITQEIGKKPVLSFGNSSGDVAMHEYTLSNENYNSMAFMVVADDVTREFGYEGEKLKERIAGWDKYHQFSMKNDFKTIYGDNVTKVTEQA